MEMLRQELGDLRRIDARDVWERETDFTKWLTANLQHLSAVLEMDLDLGESEVRVGAFAADIVAKDTSGDRWVVIENQLEPTDHSHLGQLLTYGAGLGASVFVWISPQFREEHRAALDSLNERTDEESLFFGVVVELVRVDDSRPAVNLKLVSFPNEWQKGVRTGQGGSEREVAYREFFGRVLDLFKTRYPGQTNARKPSSANWQSIGIGRSGMVMTWSFTMDRRFRVELYVDTGDKEENESIFDGLREKQEEIESAVGHGLDWDRLDERRACRISSYYSDSPIAVTDSADTLEPLTEWAADEMNLMRSAFRPRVLAPAGGADG